MLAILVAGILLFALTRRDNTSLTTQGPTSMPNQLPATNQTAAAPSAHPVHPLNTNASNATNLSSQIFAAVDSFTGKNDAAAGRQTMEHLKARLAASSPSEASAAIRQVLDSKADADTGMGFGLDAEGFPKDYPTLRLFLMDYLARVDLPAAGAYAEKILSSMDSPDEWALSLRNYGKANPTPEARAFLRQKLEQMFRNDLWQNNPSSG